MTIISIIGRIMIINQKDSNLEGNSFFNGKYKSSDMVSFSIKTLEYSKTCTTGCLQPMPTFWNIIFKVCQQNLTTDVYIAINDSYR